MNKNICIINTGGTIGMCHGPDGLRPRPGYIAEQLALMPELRNPSMPRFEIIEYDPILDSSNMSPSDWQKIADDVATRYNEFDGFVVLHGTDTMAYTASALPFMLQGLGKPVILTGSQLPLGQIRNDAKANLITSMLLSADHDIPEVCILFGDRLLRGCRATKASAARFQAFESPNFEPLGAIGTTIQIHKERVRSEVKRSESISVTPIVEQEIATFRLFPGVCVAVLQNALRRPLKALVLESFGDGNGPANNADFLEAVKFACDNGTVILNCSQCRHGLSSQSNYETGTALARAGVVSGYDMTIESALAKLMFLFSQKYPVERIKELLNTDMVGEVTCPN